MLRKQSTDQIKIQFPNFSILYMIFIYAYVHYYTISRVNFCLTNFLHYEMFKSKDVISLNESFIVFHCIYLSIKPY